MNDAELTRQACAHLTAVHTLTPCASRTTPVPTMWLLPVDEAGDALLPLLAARLGCRPIADAFASRDRVLDVVTSDGPGPDLAEVSIADDDLTLGPWLAPASWREYAHAAAHVVVVLHPMRVPVDGSVHLERLAVDSATLAVVASHEDADR